MTTGEHFAPVQFVSKCLYTCIDFIVYFSSWMLCTHTRSDKSTGALHWFITSCFHLTGSVGDGGSTVEVESVWWGSEQDEKEDEREVDKWEVKNRVMGRGCKGNPIVWWLQPFPVCVPAALPSFLSYPGSQSVSHSNSDQLWVRVCAWERESERETCLHTYLHVCFPLFYF